jgi:hypothetical protein
MAAMTITAGTSKMLQSTGRGLDELEKTVEVTDLTDDPLRSMTAEYP